MLIMLLVGCLIFLVGLKELRDLAKAQQDWDIARRERLALSAMLDKVEPKHTYMTIEELIAP